LIQTIESEKARAPHCAPLAPWPHPLFPGPGARVNRVVLLSVLTARPSHQGCGFIAVRHSCARLETRKERSAQQEGQHRRIVGWDCSRKRQSQ